MKRATTVFIFLAGCSPVSIPEMPLFDVGTDLSTSEVSPEDLGPDEIKCQNDEDCAQMPGITNCTRPACVGGVCELQSACDDGNVCTMDYCKDNQCTHDFIDVECDDNDPCTENDRCVLGKCKGIPINCDDNNPCTKDFCSGQCIHEPLEGEKCDDHNSCTVNDRCDKNGECIGGAIVLCNDGNECTEDSCDPTQGCVYVLIPQCMPCTTEKDCPQQPPCMKAVCENGKCAIQAVDGETCDDGNMCTEGDFCEKGECYSGQIKECGDDNPCTFDYCDPETGLCEHEAVSGSCDDNNPCTYKDHCENGECVGIPVVCDDGNVCTDDFCENGLCVTYFNSAACDDGDQCTDNDICVEGTCIGSKISCDDGLACTVDSCSETDGCIFTPTCNEPNPVCTDLDTPDAGCACRWKQNNIILTDWCDPVLANRCDKYKGCMCGNLPACKPPEQCCFSPISNGFMCCPDCMFCPF